MLAPIALPEEGACADLILEGQIKDEAALKPKAGEKIKGNDKELTWKNTLKKGLNVVVFKIINEQGNWQGAVRFLDKAGAPVKDLRIKLSP